MPDKSKKRGAAPIVTFSFSSKSEKEPRQVYSPPGGVPEDSEDSDRESRVRDDDPYSVESYVSELCLEMRQAAVLQALFNGTLTDAMVKTSQTTLGGTSDASAD